MYYVPRRTPDRDPLYGEDDTSYYDRAYLTVFYLISVDGFTGDGAFLSRFGGIVINDGISIYIPIEDFEEDVTAHEPTITRPREGDVVLLRYNDRLFQVRFVDNRPEFYVHGILVGYRMELTLFEYSSDRFVTGIEEIDRIYRNRSTDSRLSSILTENGIVITSEYGDVLVRESYDVPDYVDDTPTIKAEADEVIDWSEKDPFGTGSRF